ncbi:MAG: sugar kinase [Mycobacterium sp.]
MTTPDVMSIGETMVALRSQTMLSTGGTVSTSIAGAESNVAIALARLGHQSSWVGRVGSDAMGDLVLRTLRAEGVDVSGARRDTASTGVVFFERRLPTMQRVSYMRTGSAATQLCPADVDVPKGTRIVHVTGVTAALGPNPRAAVFAAVEQARDRGALVSVDVNFRSRLWDADDARPVLTELAAGADVLIASPEELALLAHGPEPLPTKDLAGRLIADGVTEVVVKDGAGPAFVVTSDGTITEHARDVSVVDSVGAGDAFVGGYLSGVLDGLSLHDRLRRAHTLGAFAVATVGDWEGLPTRDELELLRAGPGTVLR